MKSILKKISSSLAALLLVLTPVLGFAPAVYGQATGNISENVCNGLEATGSTCDDAAAEDNFASLAQRIINIFSIVVGAISVIMIIIGGFRYIISGGDSNGVTGAKNTILYAIVGLVIVLFAQVIVRFVLSNTTSQ